MLSPGCILTWIRSPDFNAKNFAAGFSLQTSAGGSFYEAPHSAGGPILLLSSGSLLLSGGGLANAITNPFTIGKDDRVLTGTNSWSMQFIAGQGLFKGAATDPVSGKRFPFSGALLQKQNGGSGFFVRPTGYGRVTVGP